MFLVSSLLSGPEVMAEGHGLGPGWCQDQESLAEEKGLSSPDLFPRNHLSSLWVSFLLRILRERTRCSFRGLLVLRNFCDVR